MEKVSTMWKNFRKNIHVKDLNFVRRFKLYRFKKSAIIVTSIVAVLLFNFLFSYISIRLDLSKGQAYTLSRSTKELVQKLQNPVTITLYASDNIPARLQPLQREVIDLLKEYERASGNVKIQISEFNPTEDQKVLETIQQSGIIGIPIREQQQNEVSVTEVYFGIILKIQDKQEVVGQALDVGNLEYNLTSAIYRMTNPELPQIAVIGSDGGLDPQMDELGEFKRIASSIFNLQPVTPPVPSEEDLDVEAPIVIDPNSKALLVFDSPQNEFSDEDLSAISDYVTKGNAIFFTNGVTINDSTLETASGEAKLHSILKPFGIDVQPNLVLSTRAEMVNLGGGGYSLYVPYPMWMKTDEFNTEVSYFSGVGSLTFPWASSLRLSDGDGYKVQNLVQTAAESWEQRESFVLNPQQIPEPEQRDIDTFSIAAEAVSDAGNKVMVIGSSRFIYSQYLSREAQNLEFLINILSDYASGGALSGISRRVVSIYSLPVLPKSVQETYKYVNILLLPALFGAYGVYRLVKRNRE